MPTITSPGIASGLDVNNIITQLMSLERIPLNKLTTKEASYNAKLTAYGSIKGALSSLETAAKALATDSTISGKSVSVSDSTVLAASASSTAVAGSYSLSITQLAKSHTVRSNTSYAATSDSFNTGTLAIAIHGGTAVNVTIDGTNNTLAGIRQAINDADAGVTATIINDGTTNRLVLSSDTSGSVGDISVAVTDDGSGGTHALLGLDSASLVQTQPADDAVLIINGIAITRTSNTITDAIEGVTLSLAKGTVTTPGTATLTIAKDTAATTTAVDTFVKAYNTAVGLLKTSSAYGASITTGAALAGDGTVRALQSQLSSLVQSSVSGVAGGISTLSDMGISIKTGGTLEVDSAKLAAALADPAKDVSALFTQTTTSNEGIAVRFSEALHSIVTFGGLIANRTDGIAASIKSIGQSRDSFNLRLVQIEARYRAQFTALDSVMSSMSRTSQFLSQQLPRL
jgi:flagellar hook-associated protein 2